MSEGRVLIVDDDDDIRANLADILGEFDYVTKTASCGETALRFIREDNFDVVLLDFKMPGMDGATLYDEIRKIRPSIAAIMITAWAGSDGVQRAREAGTWEVMRKPVDISELLQNVENATTAPVVLVVDDDRSFCEMLWRLLNQKQYRVELAHTEEEGIESVVSTHFDVAIVDLRLGHGNGIKVIDEIHKHLPSTKTFLISGDVRNATAESKKLSERIEAVIEKPVRLDSLLRMINQPNSQP